MVVVDVDEASGEEDDPFFGDRAGVGVVGCGLVAGDGLLGDGVVGLRTGSVHSSTGS